MHRHQPKPAGQHREDPNLLQPIEAADFDRAVHSESEANFPELETSLHESSVKLPKIIPFETLSRCGDEVWIENGGQIYRLRKTKQGKLILTK